MRVEMKNTSSHDALLRVMLVPAKPTSDLTRRFEYFDHPVQKYCMNALDAKLWIQDLSRVTELDDK